MGSKTGNRSPQRAEVGLRIKLLRSIIRKKEQEIEDELDREIELDFDEDNEEAQSLEKHFKQLEILLESMDEPSGLFSVSSSFDELYDEISVQNASDATKKPSVPVSIKRIRDTSDESDVQQECCELQPPEKMPKKEI